MVWIALAARTVARAVRQAAASHVMKPGLRRARSVSNTSRAGAALVDPAAVAEWNDAAGFSVGRAERGLRQEALRAGARTSIAVS